MAKPIRALELHYAMILFLIIIIIIIIVIIMIIIIYIYIYTKISLSVIVILYCIVCSLFVAVRSPWRLLFRLLNLSAAIVERSSLCTDAPPPLGKNRGESESHRDFCSRAIVV